VGFEVITETVTAGTHSKSGDGDISRLFEFSETDGKPVPKITPKGYWQLAVQW